MRTEIISLTMAMPALLLAAIGLRYLFARFVQESTELFTDLDLSKETALDIGTRMAIRNCVIYSLAAFFFTLSTILHLPALVTAATGVAGVLAALAVTIAIVRATLDVDPLPASLIGLISFAGGGLPLIVLIPAILSIATIM